MTELRGIDVSKWNDKINWQAVAKSGIRFAFVRAGTGASKGGFSLDPKFAVNVNGAHEAGIGVGVYLYSYARSVEAARMEAQKMLASIEKYRDKITWPVVYDIEEDAQAALGQSICTAMCNAFCDAVKDAGYTPMVYCSASWYRDHLLPANIHADFWIAKWSSKPPEAGNYTVWQYTDSGAVPGISGNVDLDMANVDYGKMPEDAEYLEQEPDDTPPEPEPKDEADGWAADAWKAAFVAGVLDGTRPKDGITRQELALVLQRLGLT